MVNMLGKEKLLIGRYGGLNGKTLANGNWKQVFTCWNFLLFWLARGRG